MKQCGSGLPVFAKRVKAFTARYRAAAHDSFWTRGLAWWLVIIEYNGSESSEGKNVLDKVRLGEREAALLDIKDFCGIRWPSTIFQGGKKLQLFIKWAAGAREHWLRLRLVILLA